MFILKVMRIVQWPIVFIGNAPFEAHSGVMVVIAALICAM